MKIDIDYDKCIGIGSCEAILPDIFEVGDSGQVEVLVPGPGPELDEKVKEAAAACPTAAILLT